jgi:hypothetical protein
VLAGRVALLVVLLVGAAAGFALPAEGQPPLHLPAGTEVGPDATVDAPPTQPPGGVPGNMLPGPEPGPKPDDPGDRGGWLQLTVLGLIVVAIVAIVLLVWRESRSRRPDVRH